MMSCKLTFSIWIRKLKADHFHLDPDYELKAEPFNLNPDNYLIVPSLKIRTMISLILIKFVTK